MKTENENNTNLVMVYVVVEWWVNCLECLKDK